MLSLTIKAVVVLAPILLVTTSTRHDSNVGPPQRSICQSTLVHSVRKVKKLATQGHSKTTFTQQSGKLYYMPLEPEAVTADQVLYADSRHWAKQAREMFDAGDSVSAEQLCQKALSAAPIIHGRQVPDTNIYQLLGEIYLASGQNERALQAFALYSPADFGDPSLWSNSNSFHLDLALAYCRSGNYEMALRYYADNSSRNEEFSGKPLDPSDIPRTNDLQGLEGSILLARAFSYSGMAETDHALLDVATAAKLVSENAYVAYEYGCLLLEKRRYPEAQQAFEFAASYGHSSFVGDAKYKITIAKFEAQRQAEHPQVSK